MPMTTWDTTQTWGQPYIPEDTTKRDTVTMGGGGGMTGGIAGNIPQYPTLPKYESPKYPTLPTYGGPDMGRVSQLTQQFASPVIRQARTGLRETIAGGSRLNPIQRQAQTRGALEGFGGAVEGGIAGARQPALSAASRESEMAFKTQYDQLMGEYNAAVRSGDVNYQNQLKKIMGDYETRMGAYKTQQQTEQMKGQNLGIGIAPWTTSGMGSVKKPFTSYEEDFTGKPDPYYGMSREQIARKTGTLTPDEANLEWLHKWANSGVNDIINAIGGNTQIPNTNKTSESPTTKNPFPNQPGGLTGEIPYWGG